MLKLSRRPLQLIVLLGLVFFGTVWVSRRATRLPPSSHVGPPATKGEGTISEGVINPSKDSASTNSITANSNSASPPSWEQINWGIKLRPGEYEDPLYTGLEEDVLLLEGIQPTQLRTAREIVRAVDREMERAMKEKNIERTLFLRSILTGTYELAIPSFSKSAAAEAGIIRAFILMGGLPVDSEISKIAFSRATTDSSPLIRAAAAVLLTQWQDLSVEMWLRSEKNQEGLTAFLTHLNFPEAKIAQGEAGRREGEKGRRVLRLGARTGSYLLDQITQMALNTHEPLLRKRISVFVGYHIEEPLAKNWLLHQLSSEPDVEVKGTILDSLTFGVHDPIIRTAITDYIHSEDEDLATRAITSLQMAEDLDTVQRLVSLIGETNSERAFVAVRTLGYIAQANMNLVVGALTDTSVNHPDESIRKAAQKALREIRGIRK